MSDPALSEKGLPFRSDEQNTGSGVCQSGIGISISHEAKPQAALAGMSQADETDPTGFSSIQQVDDRGDNCSNHNPEQLKPVEKRDTREFWVLEIIERRPAQRDKRDEQEQK
jgi:hypothetical protein